MKPRPTQFGVRENTASLRQHASRLAVRPYTLQSPELLRSPLDEVPVRQFAPQPAEAFSTPHNPLGNGATVGNEEGTLLTVREVAETFQVPVSWVYERTRRRGQDCLPHIKLGKYLRFELKAVREWLGQRRHA